MQGSAEPVADHLALYDDEIEGRSGGIERQQSSSWASEFNGRNYRSPVSRSFRGKDLRSQLRSILRYRTGLTILTISILPTARMVTSTIFLKHKT